VAVAFVQRHPLATRVALPAVMQSNVARVVMRG
jgi:hypothetical protein